MGKSDEGRQREKALEAQSMQDAERKKIAYLVACVHAFADRKRIHPSEAFLYLYQRQGISFLSDCYEIEHTLSLEDALDDLEMICRRSSV